MPTICQKSCPPNLTHILSTRNSIILQMSLAVYLLSPFKGSLVKQLLVLPTLMQVYCVAPFLCLKALFIDVAHTRLEQIMGDGSARGRIECLNGSDLI